MRYIFVGLLLIVISGAGYLFMQGSDEKKSMNKQIADIVYVPIGDSFTAGTGVFKNQSYPFLLTDHLKKEGIDIVLVTNPAVSGYTTKDAIQYEVPVLASSDANFVTVLIGANDIMGIDSETFRHSFRELLDKIQAELPVKENIVVMTIPDFSWTPHAQSFGYPSQEIKDMIVVFNAVITDEAKRRNISIVNLYSLTEQFENNSEMLVADGFHPSAKQYAIWENEIFPVVYDILK